MSVVATAGAVAWVAPEILTAKPADGAVLSGTATEAPAAWPQLPASRWVRVRRRARSRW